MVSTDQRISARTATTSRKSQDLGYPPLPRRPLVLPQIPSPNQDNENTETRRRRLPSLLATQIPIVAIEIKKCIGSCYRCHWLFFSFYFRVIIWVTGTERRHKPPPPNIGIPVYIFTCILTTQLRADSVNPSTARVGRPPRCTAGTRTRPHKYTQ